MTVYLVGGGPGDPGLLTVRALEVLQRAEVVVYDRLSQESLLDLAPTSAECIDVGKAPGHARFSQEEINALLVERGKGGQTVVRLKGGDPFVFARGGEEAAALLAAGVEFEVVPGVTSAIAVPAYAGIPVTQRHSSTSVTIVTGHEDPGAGEEGTVDWRAVAQVGGTIVILMGVARIGRIAAALMAAGRSPDTPVAAIQWGTRPNQRTVRATLGTISQQELGTPSVIVVGEVAACDLSWYEKRPLFGKTIVVTRAREQASELVSKLTDLGADTVEVPAIELREPADGGAALQQAVAELSTYDWVVVTSPNGARALLVTLRTQGLDARAFGPARVAAIGPGGGALDGVGHVVDLLVADAPLPEVLGACAALVPGYLGAAAVVGQIDGQEAIGVATGSEVEPFCADDRWWRDTMADGKVRSLGDFADFPDDLTEPARRAGFLSAWDLPVLEASTGEVIGCVVVWVRVDVELNIGTDHALRQTQRLASLVIGEQRRHHALRREAVTDPLTGLGNRSALRRRLDAATGPVTVAFVDLDDFKAVNDSYGHDAGDTVLREVALRLGASVREDDLVVRLGGDEFAVVFADGKPADGVDQLVRRILDSIETPISLGPESAITVLASIGVATGPPSEVVHRADDALYATKRSKRTAD